MKSNFSRAVCAGAFLFVLFVWAFPEAILAEPLGLDVLNPTRVVAPTSIQVYQGTIANDTGLDLIASDLFFNFFGFDPQLVSLTQLLGFPDFTIANGSTSPIVDLFDFTLGPNAPPGTYHADVLLEDFLGDTSDVVTVTEQVLIPEPSNSALLLISALLCLLVCRLFRTSEGAKITVRAGDLILPVVFLLMVESVPGYGADTPVIFATAEPGVSPEGSTILHSALPILNTGTATADNVLVTSIQLQGGSPIAPVLPVGLGSIPAGGRTTLLADFAGASFVPGGRYFLTVSGTYMVGTSEYGFTLNRPLIVPPVPGSRPVRKIPMSIGEVSGGAYPGGPTTESTDVEAGRPIPHGPVSSVPPPLLQSLEFINSGTVPFGVSPLDSPKDPKLLIHKNFTVKDGSLDEDIFRRNDFGTGFLNTAREPSGAVGNGVDFVTYNFRASYGLESGIPGHFIQINPHGIDIGPIHTGVFPNDGGGFCCDQVVQYAPPPIDRFIWLLQYNTQKKGFFPQNFIRMAVASPQQILDSTASNWKVGDFRSADFGQLFGGSTGWLDNPDMSVGDNFLYVSFNVISVGGGLEVCRAPLTAIANLPDNLVWECTYPDPVDTGSHLSQHTGDTVFWAGHLNASQIDVTSWTEGAPAPELRTKDIWRGPKDEGISAIDPDRVDWLQFYRCGQDANGVTVDCPVEMPMCLFDCLTRAVSGAPITGATRITNVTVISQTDVLWLAWTSGAGSLPHFTRPHIEMVALDILNNFDIVETVAFGGEHLALALPAIVANDLGEIGMTFEGQVDGQWPQHVVAILDPAHPDQTQAYQSTGGDLGSNRYGDYVTIRPYFGNPPCAFAAFGYGQYFVGEDDSHHANVKYVLFSSDQCVPSSG
jgi:hypothetical protein